MLGFVLAAGILGIIIAVMEQDAFPGWFKMFFCVLCAFIPTFLLSMVLPSGSGVVAMLAGAICAAFAIAATCGMSLKRAGIASAIYFVIQIIISMIIH